MYVMLKKDFEKSYLGREPINEVYIKIYDLKLAHRHKDLLVIKDKKNLNFFYLKYNVKLKDDCFSYLMNPKSFVESKLENVPTFTKESTYLIYYDGTNEVREKFKKIAKTNKKLIKLSVSDDDWFIERLFDKYDVESSKVSKGGEISTYKL